MSTEYPNPTNVRSGHEEHTEHLAFAPAMQALSNVLSDAGNMEMYRQQWQWGEDGLVIKQLVGGFAVVTLQRYITIPNQFGGRRAMQAAASYTYADKCYWDNLPTAGPVIDVQPVRVPEGFLQWVNSTVDNINTVTGNTSHQT